MARSVFSARTEYVLRVDGKIFGVLFPTLEEAEEMARTFVSRGAAKVVITRNGRGLVVKRFSRTAAPPDLAKAPAGQGEGAKPS
jgi:hypothetical protein